MSRLKEIPVIINNRNRITYLKKLINRLEKAGMRNIFIIDNASTYPPLLEFYLHMPYKVFRFEENLGFTALWDTNLFKVFRYTYYIYTDPDVVPVDECPDDFVYHLYEVLKRHPGIEKVGLGLKIDDLPDHYSRKGEVINWERQFWQNEVEKDLYDAYVETTFALYRPLAKGPAWECKAYRTGGDYMARHLPWYENSNDLDEESLYYMKTIKDFTSVWSESHRQYAKQ
jgi:glycosyltransferase involved in cell wall biosynthesis